MNSTAGLAVPGVASIWRQGSTRQIGIHGHACVLPHLCAMHHQLNTAQSQCAAPWNHASHTPTYVATPSQSHPWQGLGAVSPAYEGWCQVLEPTDPIQGDKQLLVADSAPRLCGLDDSPDTALAGHHSWHSAAAAAAGDTHVQQQHQQHQQQQQQEQQHQHQHQPQEQEQEHSQVSAHADNLKGGGWVDPHVHTMSCPATSQATSHPTPPEYAVAHASPQPQAAAPLLSASAVQHIPAHAGGCTEQLHHSACGTRDAVRAHLGRLMQRALSCPREGDAASSPPHGGAGCTGTSQGHGSSHHATWCRGASAGRSSPAIGGPATRLPPHPLPRSSPVRAVDGSATATATGTARGCPISGAAQRHAAGHHAPERHAPGRMQSHGALHAAGAGAVLEASAGPPPPVPVKRGRGRPRKMEAFALPGSHPASSSSSSSNGDNGDEGGSTGGSEPGSTASTPQGGQAPGEQHHSAGPEGNSHHPAQPPQLTQPPQLSSQQTPASPGSTSPAVDSSPGPSPPVIKAQGALTGPASGGSVTTAAGVAEPAAGNPASKGVKAVGPASGALTSQAPGVAGGRRLRSPLAASPVVQESEMASERAWTNPVYRMIRKTELQMAWGRTPRDLTDQTTSTAQGAQGGSPAAPASASPDSHTTTARDPSGVDTQRSAAGMGATGAAEVAGRSSVGGGSREVVQPVVQESEMASEGAWRNPVYRLIRKTELRMKRHAGPGTTPASTAAPPPAAQPAPRPPGLASLLSLSDSLLSLSSIGDTLDPGLSLALDPGAALALDTGGVTGLTGVRQRVGVTGAARTGAGRATGGQLRPWEGARPLAASRGSPAQLPAEPLQAAEPGPRASGWLGPGMGDGEQKQERGEDGGTRDEGVAGPGIQMEVGGERNDGGGSAPGALPSLPRFGHVGVDRAIRIRQLSLLQRRKQQAAGSPSAAATGPTPGAYTAQPSHLRAWTPAPQRAGDYQIWYPDPDTLWEGAPSQGPTSGAPTPATNNPSPQRGDRQPVPVDTTRVGRSAGSSSSPPAPKAVEAEPVAPRGPARPRGATRGEELRAPPVPSGIVRRRGRPRVHPLLTSPLSPPRPQGRPRTNPLPLPALPGQPRARLHPSLHDAAVGEVVKLLGLNADWERVAAAGVQALAAARSKALSKARQVLRAQPNIALRSPVALAGNLDGLAATLAIPRARVVEAVLRYPPLVELNQATVQERYAHLLGLAAQHCPDMRPLDVAEAVCEGPALLGLTSASLWERVEALASGLATLHHGTQPVEVHGAQPNASQEALSGPPAMLNGHSASQPVLVAGGAAVQDLHGVAAGGAEASPDHADGDGPAAYTSTSGEAGPAGGVSALLASGGAGPAGGVSALSAFDGAGPAGGVSALQASDGMGRVLGTPVPALLATPDGAGLVLTAPAASAPPGGAQPASAPAVLTHALRVLLAYPGLTRCSPQRLVSGAQRLVAASQLLPVWSSDLRAMRPTYLGRCLAVSQRVMDRPHYVAHLAATLTSGGAQQQTTTALASAAGPTGAPQQQRTGGGAASLTSAQQQTGGGAGSGGGSGGESAGAVEGSGGTGAQRGAQQPEAMRLGGVPESGQQDGVGGRREGAQGAGSDELPYLEGEGYEDVVCAQRMLTLGGVLVMGAELFARRFPGFEAWRTRTNTQDDGDT